jgi:hypothetical protein
MKDDQVAALNLRLKQLGFETMGDYARALTEGVVGNRQLVDDLAEAIAEKMVVKMTTTLPILRQQTHTFERRVESHGRDLIPRPAAYKAAALPG